jgi:Secretory lipase
VLASRTFTDWGFWWPVKVVQLLYRSTSVLGQPTTNVTSVLLPTGTPKPGEAVSDQLAYDSLSCTNEPSLGLFNGGSEGDNPGPYLSAGIAVIIPDTEGQAADMTEGHEYGMNTLDSIRAATSSPLTGLSKNTKVALEGYSGGAWATEWAAQLAPSYAPDLESQVVGVAEGGLPVDAAHIAEYISGSEMFTCELPTALIGLARAYDVNFAPYLSAEGENDYTSMQNDSLGSTLWGCSGLTMADLLLPQYSNPDSLPLYLQIVNDENLGLLPPPKVPLYIVQGGTGWPEGAQPQPPSIGNGDGATVTGDVRALALQACAAGTPVDYLEEDNDDHLLAATVWAANVQSWVTNVLGGGAAPNTCSSIAPGNSLAPEQAP